MTVVAPESTSTNHEAVPPAGVPAARRRVSAAWCGAAVLALLLYVAVRIVREPRYFFWDDTQLGAFGQWYGLGTKLLTGQWSVLAPGSWQGGNYLAEGQWGLWNPLTWMIAIGAHVVGNATIYATLIKVGFLIALTVGTYLLALEYGAKSPWAALAGFTVAVGGQTIFIDAPSWVTGLQSVAIFAFTWWALKRTVARRRNPLLFLVFAYMLIALGYVFGTIELVFLLATFLIESLVRRERSDALRILVLGVYCGLLTVFIYLPGVLTSPVTTRSGAQIANDQFLNMDLGDLATSPITTAVSSVRGYWGDLLPVPLQYVTWLLPLLVLFGAGWRRTLNRAVAPVAILILTLAMVLGPSVVGPLRYPERMMPYAVLSISVFFAVAASSQWEKRPSRARIWAAVVITVAAGWFAWAAQPSSWPWVLLATALQAGAIVLIARDRVRLRSLDYGSRTAALLLAGSLIVLAPQVVRYPSSPLGNFNVPSSSSAMHEVGNGLDDGIFTVGDIYSLQAHPQSYNESLLANLWYLTRKDSASVYTVLPFTNLTKTLCLDLRGATCPAALDALFRDDTHPLADDMSLNTVIVIKGPGLEDRPTVPAGWHLTEREYTWLLQRDDPLPRAGGVARTSDGTTVHVNSQDATTVTFRVDAVAGERGQVVLSRLAWPGYTTSEASFASPVRGFLLTVAVGPDDVGKTITVHFSPPGWTLEVVSFALAMLIGVALAAGAFLRSRRATRPRTRT